MTLSEFQSTFLSPLPERFEKGRRAAKHRTQRLPDQMPDGPCCGRCGNFVPPPDPNGDPFGECRAVVRVLERIGGKSGHLVAVDEPAYVDVIHRFLLTEPMRIREWAAACSRYVALSDEEAA